MTSSDNDSVINEKKKIKRTILIYVPLFILSLIILFEYFLVLLFIIYADWGFGAFIELTLEYLSEFSILMFIPIVGPILLIVSVWKLYKAISSWMKLKENEYYDEESI